MNEHVNLSDIMGNNPPERSVNVFDITSGKGAVEASETHKAAAIPKQQYRAVNSGPIDMSTMRPVDIDTILPKREQTSSMENKLMDDLDAAIARECNSITERHNAIFAAQEEEREAEIQRQEDLDMEAEDNFALTGVAAPAIVNIDNHDDDEDNMYDQGVFNRRFGIGTTNEDIGDTKAATSTEIKEPEYAHNITTTPAVVSIINEEHEAEGGEPMTPIKADNDKVNILDNIADDDLFDDEDEETPSVATEDDGPSAEEMLNDLKSQIKQRSPIRKILDLSKFTVAKKAISAQKVMKLAIHSHQNVADWVLPCAKRAISMTGLSGPEILKLNPENSNRNRINTFREMYRVIYDHVYDANKPDYEAWLKTLRFADLQHVYFALYMATFGGSNFVNYSCPKCNKVFIKDIDFKDMVVYADDESKTMIQNLLKMDTTTANAGEYETELIQVSDHYVFGIRTPSVWNVIIETASLSEQFLEKYADLIDLVAYIDCAYIIDEENEQLIPVDTRPDPDDVAKTSARRIRTLHNIISTLSSEEFYALRAAITNMDEIATKVTYKIPGCTCPDCATEIPANTNMTPDSMLFTRHQLAAIGNM